MSRITETIYDEIVTERFYQDAKWGDAKERSLSYGMWLLILQEEIGEWAQAVLNGEYDHAHKELIQVAAVAVAMLEAEGNMYQHESYS